MRSKLFVPGSRPELFDKALTGAADAISLDLEDAVVEARKAEARDVVRTFLRTRAVGSGKTLIVRVNALATPHFAADVAAVVQKGLHVINLPKPESAGDVQAAAETVGRAEAANGVTTKIGLLLNIETPKGLRAAAAMAAAHPRVVGLQLGLADLFEPQGIDRKDLAAVHHAMFSVKLAAAEAGVYAYDSAFADIADTAGFRAEASRARALGFIGKSCIHPSQIALANETFQPTAAEIAQALKIVAAAQAPENKGAGAFTVDGKMIDAPFVVRAEAIVATARRLGLVPG
jgi:citrate lyase subunit beta/citryl-CoA lyase